LKVFSKRSRLRGTHPISRFIITGFGITVSINVHGAFPKNRSVEQ
jgi:hypothetical protein